MKVYAPKFPPITFVKVCPKFECNIYSDTDVQSAISVSFTGNSRSFTVLTDRLAFVNFSSPAMMYDLLNIFLQLTHLCFVDFYIE